MTQGKNTTGGKNEPRVSKVPKVPYTPSTEELIPRKGNYKALITYQKAESIYDMTYYFCSNHLRRGDRTVDQMVQAARSGKQNIVEGSAASATSSEMEIKLVSVAKASLHELLVDYEDYLRTREHRQWEEKPYRGSGPLLDLPKTLLHTHYQIF